MYRVLFAAAVAVAVFASPVQAKRIARPFTPLEKAVRAETVVVGKVTAIEKNTVSAPMFPGEPMKTDYKIAVIKVEEGLIGAGSVTHIKVGFIPQAADPADPAVPPVRPGRGGFGPVNLTEGMEGMFYLTKHHSGEFYVISPMMPPAGAKDEGYKAQVEVAKKAAAVLADPMKALKSAKADDRSFAAVLLVMKYRSYPENAAEVDTVKVSAEESALILKGLAEGNWKPTDENLPNAYMAFSLLGLNDKDGWKFPMLKPGEDFIDKTKEAFAAWLAAQGKDYQVSKLVRKK